MQDDKVPEDKPSEQNGSVPRERSRSRDRAQPGTSSTQPSSSSTGPVRPIALDNNDPDTDNDDDETDHGTIYYPDMDHDLLVLEDNGIWEALPDEHKIVSKFQ